MKARIDNPVMTFPQALEGLRQFSGAAQQSGLPPTLGMLVALRASQINGCSVCVDMHSRELKAAGEPDRRIHTLAAWREAPYFSDAERAALALTEAATRLADHSQGVPDEVWEQAAEHFDERQLAGLVISIASINTWNRLNAVTRQITGEWVSQWIEVPAQAA
jgi:AhpD family alkylhydroperoxidase